TLAGTGVRRLQDLQRRHDFPASEGLDLEFPLGQLPHALTHGFDTAVKRIETLRPARCQPPTHCGAGLSDRRSRNRGRSHARARSHEKRTPLHFGSPAEMYLLEPAPPSDLQFFAVASARSVDKSLTQSRARASMTEYLPPCENRGWCDEEDGPMVTGMKPARKHVQRLAGKRKARRGKAKKGS